VSAVLVYTIGNLFHTPIHDTQLSEDRIHERGLLTVPDEVWHLAVQRAEVIAPLADASSVGAGAVDATGRSRPAYERAQRLLIDLGVPTDFIPSFGEYLCGTQEAEAALRLR